MILVLALSGVSCRQPTSVFTAPPVEIAPSAVPPLAPNPVSLPALMQHKFDGRDFTVGRVLSENEVYTRYYITYKSGELSISGIMNLPKGSSPADGFPVLILNHGHIDTDIYTNGRGLKREQDYLVRRGFVVVHPDYRNHAESDDDPNVELTFRLGYSEDVINAVYALRAAGLPYVDVSRVGMLGHSMGGGITQNVLVVEPSLVQAAVLYAPVSGDYGENYERYTRRRLEIAQELATAYGTPQENPEFWRNISATTYYDRINAPVQVHIGTRDESVEEAWSYAIRDRLTTLGKEVVLFEYPGEPHEFAHAWELFMQRTAEFFTARLAPAPTSAE